ncbi:superoxide dismutase family protein [Fulvivirga ulvae]|uniref:superoxide dismutase family protein n=1 Tax=Fulvivirga ulvae TaxID=2904245 RepID=UPI001F465A21|nr:superoxide dismutase family protein [Fulvivirga ulvae]UII31398.1 superoxide dismutase family protein [Fulvivirga ulvae]
MKILKNHLPVFGLVILLFSCGPGSEDRRDTMEDNGELNESAEDITDEDMNTENVEEMAFADIHSASGSTLTGKATFTNTGNERVKFELNVENAKPGSHAVHIHEKGDCSAKDAKSAGGHWNPTNEKHGKRGNPPFHKGDIGNMEVDTDGKGSMSMTIEGWCIDGDSLCSIIDKAVIIHTGADDFTSQPSGAAGDRIGCGVIKNQ